MTDVAQLKLDQIKKQLTELANLPTLTDEEEFDIDGHCAGQTDDAYYSGQNDGEILLARDLLNMFFAE